MQTPRTHNVGWSTFLFFALSVLFTVAFALVAISIATTEKDTLLVLLFGVCSLGAMIQAWIFGRRLKWRR